MTTLPGNSQEWIEALVNEWSRGRLNEGEREAVRGGEGGDSVLGREFTLTGHAL